MRCGGLCCWGHWLREQERDQELSGSILTHPFHCLLKSFGIRSPGTSLCILYLTFCGSQRDPAESLRNLFSTSLRKRYLHTFACNFKKFTPGIPSYETLVCGPPFLSLSSLLEVFFSSWSFRAAGQKSTDVGVRQASLALYGLTVRVRMNPSLFVKWDINVSLAGGIGKCDRYSTYPRV